MIVSFQVPGNIVPWARTGGGKGTPRFTPKRQRDYKAVIRSLAADAMGDRDPVDHAVELRLIAVYPWPKSMTKRRRVEVDSHFKATKPDGDNIQKIVKDGLNQIVWTDDARVAVVHFAKLFGSRAALHVEVHALSDSSWPRGFRDA